MNIFKWTVFAAGAAGFLFTPFCATSAEAERKPLGTIQAVPISKPSAPPAKVKDGKDAAGEPVITHLEFRDKKVTIKAGARGPVYEVRNKEGKIIGKDLSDKELQAREPELYRLIQTAVGSGSKDGRVMDARRSISIR